MVRNKGAKPLASSGEYKDEVLMRQAQIAANAFAKAFNKKYRLDIPVPVPMDFELHKHDPRTAGMAYWPVYRISLNLVMLREYPEEFLNKTIPHEVAHLAEYCMDRKMKIETKPGHNWQWSNMMKGMGQEVRVCHGMSTKKAVAAYKAYKKTLKTKAKLTS
jgi:hypothetical protein